MHCNRIFRLFFLLLILSSFSIFSVVITMARFTTSTSGGDIARTASFGVELSLASDNNRLVFSDKYNKGDLSHLDYPNGLNTSDAVAVSVASSDESSVVAPGTTSYLNFRITGTPEVAVKLDFSFNIIEYTAFLPIGSYANPSVTNPDGTNPQLTITEPYHPVLFTLYIRTAKKHNLDHEVIYDPVFQGDIYELKTYLEALSKSFNAGSSVETDYYLTWEWTYDVWFRIKTTGLDSDKSTTGDHLGLPAEVRFRVTNSNSTPAYPNYLISSVTDRLFENYSAFFTRLTEDEEMNTALDSYLGNWDLRNEAPPKLQFNFTITAAQID